MEHENCPSYRVAGCPLFSVMSIWGSEAAHGPIFGDGSYSRKYWVNFGDWYNAHTSQNTTFENAFEILTSLQQSCNAWKCSTFVKMLTKLENAHHSWKCNPWKCSQLVKMLTTLKKCSRLLKNADNSWKCSQYLNSFWKCSQLFKMLTKCMLAWKCSQLFFKMFTMLEQLLKMLTILENVHDTLGTPCYERQNVGCQRCTLYRGVSLYEFEMHAGGKWEVISQLGVAQLQLQYMRQNGLTYVYDCI